MVTMEMQAQMRAQVTMLLTVGPCQVALVSKMFLVTSTRRTMEAIRTHTEPDSQVLRLSSVLRAARTMPTTDRSRAMSLA